MASFLKVVLIILIIYYVLKLIGRVVFPWLLKRWVNNLQKRYSQQPFGYGGQQPYEQEKDRVTVHTSKQQNKKSSSKDGEYVDYEEVK